MIDLQVTPPLSTPWRYRGSAQASVWRPSWSVWWSWPCIAWAPKALTTGAGDIWGSPWIPRFMKPVGMNYQPWGHGLWSLLGLCFGDENDESVTKKNTDNSKSWPSISSHKRVVILRCLIAPLWLYVTLEGNIEMVDGLFIGQCGRTVVSFAQWKCAELGVR